MAQVVVYGPNGARTTANTEKRPGEKKSEYERLLAGEIKGREGYAGATQAEPLTEEIILVIMVVKMLLLQ